MNKYIQMTVNSLAGEISKEVTYTDEGDASCRQAAFRLRSNYKKCRDNLLKVITKMYGKQKVHA